MSITLLTTKLYIPPVRPELVARTRLIAQLDNGLSHGRRLTLISASAGFGKTTLLSEWASHLGSGRVCWISLDEGDNDPVRFLAYFLGALKTVGVEVGDSVLGALRSPQAPSFEAVLTSLINEIAAGRVSEENGQPIVLVLDDFQVITASPVQHALTFLLDHLPPSLHLAIATRADPALPLARLRGRDQLTELRVADLRFTYDEAAAFLKQTMGLDLSADDVSALEARTEGWITGLQLAGLALGRQWELGSDQFVRDFSSSDRYIIDYLGDEVLARHTEDVQLFLLETSILERLTGPLCAAVAGRSDSAELLEHLERANMFLIPLDPGRRWYRYHRLFADSLRERLVRMHRDRLPELHRKAARWYEAQNSTEEAIHHWLAAGAFSEAAQLIEDSALSALGRGEMMTLSGWISRLPESVVRARPRLCVFHAWTLLLTGHVDAVETYLRDAEMALKTQAAAIRERELAQTADARDITGHIAAIRAYAATFGRAPKGVSILAREALENLAEDNLFLRSIVAFLLGGASLMENDSEGASQAFAEAAAMGRLAGNIHLAVPALCAVASLEEIQGKLHQAARTYQTARELASGLAVAAGGYTGTGEVLYQWNDLDAAARYLEEGVELAKRWGNPETTVNSLISLAQLRTTLGDPEGALALLEEAERSLRRQATMPGTDAALAAYRMRLYVNEGQPAAAARYAAERGLSVDDEFNLLRELEHIALARVLVAQNSPAASGFVARLLESAEEGGRTGRVIQILIIKALAHRTLDDLNAALVALERALSLAEPEDYVRIFLDEGPAMAELLRRVASRGPKTEYVKRLLSLFNAKTKNGGRKIDVSTSASLSSVVSLIEPLSERELEVLRLIADGLSNQQVADQLVIALGTVKAHTSSIYGKLGVRSRTQAVARARELEIL